MAQVQQPSFVVRDYEERDANTVKEMMRALIKLRGLKTRFIMLNAAYDAYFAPYLKGVAKGGDNVVKVAEDKGKIVGYAIASKSSEPAPAEHTKVAELVDMYVAESHRGIGVASALLQGLEDWARAKKLTAVVVNAFPQLEEELTALRSLGFHDWRVKLIHVIEKDRHA